VVVALAQAALGAAQLAGRSNVVTVTDLFTGEPLGREHGPFTQSWFRSKDPTPVDTGIGARLVEMGALLLVDAGQRSSR
jgi:hypothetical protein